MASTYVPFKLNNERDADILAAIADAPDKSARLRELIRQGLTVTRNTVEAPKTVLRNTEIVTRNTPEIKRSDPMTIMSEDGLTPMEIIRKRKAEAAAKLRKPGEQ